MTTTVVILAVAQLVQAVCLCFILSITRSHAAMIQGMHNTVASWCDLVHILSKQLDEMHKLCQLRHTDGK